jgi:copper homeostasis protein (lipoprotein)
MQNLKGLTATVVVSLASVALVACQEVRVAPPVTSADDPVAPAVDVKKVLAVYEGVLPCTECQGVRTELTLFDDDSSYRLVETFRGTPAGDRTVESEGTWTLWRPALRDAERAIYQLHPSGPGTLRNFLIVDERQIRQLDGQEREIDSRANYTLARKVLTATH